jgi:hypothetical protein
VTACAIHRALRLTALTTAAWLALAAFDAVRLAGFARIHGLVRRMPVRRSPSRVPVDDIVWAVEEACVWYVKRCPCLQRSVVATWLLRRGGAPAQLVIGYRPVPFESHAWVEVHGIVVNDRPQYRKAFRILDRL